MIEKINHPSHYNQGGPIGDDGSAQYEAIKIIESWNLGPGFNRGNAIKYLLRSPHKGSMADDLKKACWYLNRATQPPHRLIIDPSEAAKAWGLPDQLRMSLELIETEDPLAALFRVERYMKELGIE